MEQNSERPNEKSGFWGQTAVYIIVAVVIVVGIVYLANRNKGGQEVANKNSQGQTSNQNSNQNQGQGNQNSDNQGQVSGSGTVSATGTLQASDDASKGNLEVLSNRGKIYIFTKRDFSSLLGQTVTLNATGDIKNFAFLGFNESLGTIDTTAKGGGDTEASVVSFKGILKTSDKSELGNYVITSGHTNVYLKTAHDYSNRLGQEVTLSATGSLQSFTNATLN